MRRRWLVKGKHNLSAYKPTLASNSSTREIAADNGKLLQSITEPKGIYQPDDIIDDPITASLTVNIPQDITIEDSKLLQYTSRHNNQFLYYTNSKDIKSRDKDKDLVNNNN